MGGNFFTKNLSNVSKQNFRLQKNLFSVYRWLSRLQENSVAYTIRISVYEKNVQCIQVKVPFTSKPYSIYRR